MSSFQTQNFLFNIYYSTRGLSLYII